MNQKECSLILDWASARVAIGPVGSLRLVKIACVGGVVHRICLRKLSNNCHWSSAPSLYWGSKAGQFVNQCRLKLWMDLWHKGHGACFDWVVGNKVLDGAHAWAPCRNNSPVLWAHSWTCHSLVTLLSVRNNWASCGSGSKDGCINGGQGLWFLFRCCCRAVISIYPILLSRCTFIQCLSGLSCGGPSSLRTIVGFGFLPYQNGNSPLSLIGGNVVNMGAAATHHGWNSIPYSLLLGFMQ